MDGAVARQRWSATSDSRTTSSGPPGREKELAAFVHIYGTRKAHYRWPLAIGARELVTIKRHLDGQQREKYLPLCRRRHTDEASA
jgi:hypothetical protein